MTDHSDQKRATPPPPPPLPPHPKQAQLMVEQGQPERISPPKVIFKSSFKEKNDDPLTSSSPVSKLNPDKDEKPDQMGKGEEAGQRGKGEKTDQNKQLRKQEELIEAPYLRRILSEGAATADADRTSHLERPPQRASISTALPGSSTVPACCYAPPCVNYINDCKEIKKTLNYGRRVQVVDETPCNHYLIGRESCERCCKLITLHRNLFSLHCAWHHQLLTCFKCKMTISDLDHRVYKGNVHCEECFRRAKKLHGQEYRTIHKNP